MASINTLLDRADKMYRQLVAHRQPLDSLLMKIAEHGDNDFIKVWRHQTTGKSVNIKVNHVSNRISHLEYMTLFLE